MGGLAKSGEDPAEKLETSPRIVREMIIRAGSNQARLALRGLFYVTLWRVVCVTTLSSS